MARHAKKDLVYYSNRKRIARLVCRIRKHMKENPESVHFVKIPNIKKGRGSVQYRGYYHPDDEAIEIDYRFEVIPTLIHEYLHHFHEKWTEDKVEKEERCIMAILSKKHAISLLRRLALIVT